MAQDFSKKFYNSKSWHDCRALYIDTRINADGGLCECCHDVPGTDVHHKIKLTPQNIDDPAVTLNLDNLEYLCDKCHKSEHTADRFHLNYVFVDGVPTPRSS